MKQKHVKLVKQTVAIGILIFLIVLFSCLERIESVSEFFFARGLSRGWVYVVGHLTDGSTYALFGVLEVLAVLALIGLLVGAIVQWKKRERTKALSLLLRAATGVLCVAFLYVATASGCYYRQPVPLERYEGETLSVEETEAVLGAIFADVETIADGLTYENGKSVSPYSFEELRERLVGEYEKKDDAYYSPYTPRVKKAVFSGLLSYVGISGMTFMPTGEASVNYETPNCYFVVTAAHELAHAKGVMRERDANLVAYSLLLNSDDAYFRYCGYMFSVGYLTSVLNVMDGNAYKRVMSGYPARLREDLRREVGFWEGKSGPMERIGDFFNDVYLKLSGVKDGTKNYSDPSAYTEERTVSDGREVVRVTITYSDTARILIRRGLNELEKQGGTV